ncbi:MAG: DinB family protein [Algicola sp.]|nr:DinB family protein [Algicola sp.]
MRLFFILTLLIASHQMKAQSTELPYYELPETSAAFTAGTVAARQIDGLGFRFYWATANLTQADLNYKPNNDARTTAETILHIYDLSNVVLSAALKQPYHKDHVSQLSIEEVRAKALRNLKQAADILREAADLKVFKIDFGQGEFPFWNAINGPIADAIWHCGQIASYRRTSGNPISAKINHFTGTVTR